MTNKVKEVASESMYGQTGDIIHEGVAAGAYPEIDQSEPLPDRLKGGIEGDQDLDDILPIK